MDRDKLIEYADKLKEVSHANFPIQCLYGSAINQLSLHDIRSSDYLFRVFSVCRYYLSVQRLIDAALQLILHEQLGKKVKGIFQMEIYRPSYDDVFNLEGSDEDFPLGTVCNKQYQIEEAILREHGITIEETELEEWFFDFENMVVRPRYREFGEMVCYFTYLLEDDIHLIAPETFICYRIDIGNVNKERRVELLCQLESDLDGGDFDVGLYVSEDMQEIVLVSSAIYEPEEGNLSSVERGQVLTAASFLYLLAAVA